MPVNTFYKTHFFHPGSTAKSLPQRHAALVWTQLQLFTHCLLLALHKLPKESIGRYCNSTTINFFGKWRYTQTVICHILSGSTKKLRVASYRTDHFLLPDSFFVIQKMEKYRWRSQNESNLRIEENKTQLPKYHLLEHHVTRNSAFFCPALPSIFNSVKWIKCYISASWGKQLTGIEVAGEQ